jgi:hypothetical protein
MTRTTLVLLTLLGAVATTVSTTASALNPQPLPPMPRCSPAPCQSKPVTQHAPIVRHAGRH